VIKLPTNPFSRAVKKNRKPVGASGRRFRTELRAGAAWPGKRHRPFGYRELKAASASSDGTEEVVIGVGRLAGARRPVSLFARAQNRFFSIYQKNNQKTVFVAPGFLPPGSNDSRRGPVPAPLGVAAA
jgi:hypothetical protein